MDIPLLVPVVCLVTGVLLVLRATFLVSTKSNGRFRGDTWASLGGGFGLIYLGQFILGR